MEEQDVEQQVEDQQGLDFFVVRSFVLCLILFAFVFAFILLFYYVNTKQTFLLAQYQYKISMQTFAFDS